MNRNIRKELEVLAEPSYQKFSSRLLPGVDNILGVRLPKLRKIAKDIAREDWKCYLNRVAPEDTFEEVMLHGMIIGYLKEDIETILTEIEKFVPRITNWSLCDSFCIGLKCTRSYPQNMWEFLKKYFRSTQPYELRFAIVMLIDYYIDDEHIQDGLRYLDAVNHEDYYVKMAVAWAISMYYVHLPEPTMPYLLDNHLDDFTYNKALQKICESRCVNNDTRKLIKTLKRI